MDKTVAGLLGALGALVAASPGHAAAQPVSAETVLQARSYSELLRPIPNALATLQAMDGQGMAEPEANVEQVQLDSMLRNIVRGNDDRHDRRHDERYRRDRHHHHHYHHHHSDRRGHDRY